MKSNSFKYSVLAVGVVAAMGITTANAAITSGATSSGAAPITNVATASYNIGSVAQTATSNPVTVNVSETANFSLVAINGASPDDDKNEDIATTPGNGATFNHTLTNNGNVSDTYTINTTGNNDSTITTATPKYALGTAGSNGITYTIVKADGTAAVAGDLSAGQAVSGNLSNGGTIKLPPGFKANLSYTVTTPSTYLGGDIAVGTLTATSTFITNASSTGTKVPTLVNENQNIVRLPTFKIAKTATSNVDLSVANPQIDYNITVTNVNTAYSALADNFVIRDVLPVGMTLSGNVTAAGATVTSTGKTADDRVIIDIAVPSLAVGANQVVTFKVNVAKASYTGANSSATNNVAVYDKFVGPVGTLPTAPTIGTNYDILDSTDKNLDVTRVPSTADDANGVGADTAATTNFTRRAIVLSNPTTREIAPASGTAAQATHMTTITNNGQDTEGTDTNPLTFTIADGGGNAAVRPVTGPISVTYTPPNGGTPVTTSVSPTVTNGNTYTLNTTTLPSGIAPGGIVVINYNVSSGNVTAPSTVADAAVVGSTETTVVTLTPTGTGAPAATTVTDTTNVKGLTLEKYQALDASCTGTVSAASFSKELIEGAKPDQCIIYRINATNTSSAIQTSTPAAASGFNITGLTITDLLANFSAGADLVAGSPASTATSGSTVGAATANTTAVSTTATTLAPQGVATLSFRVKIKNAR